jgi:hypothetical protein
MIAIQTTQQISYDNRNPAKMGKIRIEIDSVRREPKNRQYVLKIIDWVIYTYEQIVPTYEEQEIETPVLDENGEPTGDVEMTTIMVQNGTTTETKEGMFIYKQNNNYIVSYEKALMLEQYVLANYPTDLTGAELRDYITKFGLMIETQTDPVPTYNVGPENWEFV